MLLNEWMGEEPTQGGSKRRKNGRLGRAISYVAPCSQRCCVKAPMFCFFSREGAGRGPSPEDEPLKDPEGSAQRCTMHCDTEHAARLGSAHGAHGAGSADSSLFPVQAVGQGTGVRTTHPSLPPSFTSSFISIMLPELR